MKVNIHIDKSQDEHIDFYIHELTPELQEIANQIQQESIIIWGSKGHTLTPLDLNLVTRIYTDSSHVCAAYENETYVIKYRIYQIAKILPSNFIQISNSEILNFDYLDHLELERNGTIKLLLKNNDYTFASRRFVKNIKRRLGI
nr:LytTR family DNA-binding domain-containing protein [uncultured Ligilactobacillus sp.]